MTSTSVQFLKNKHTFDLYKVIFCQQVILIWCDTGSCCEHLTGAANTYLYICVSLLVPVCRVCVCLCV